MNSSDSRSLNTLIFQPRYIPGLLYGNLFSLSSLIFIYVGNQVHSGLGETAYNHQVIVVDNCIFIVIGEFIFPLLIQLTLVSNFFIPGWTTTCYTGGIFPWIYIRNNLDVEVRPTWIETKVSHQVSQGGLPCSYGTLQTIEDADNNNGLYPTCTKILSGFKVYLLIGLRIQINVMYVSA